MMITLREKMYWMSMETLNTHVLIIALVEVAIQETS